MNQKFDTFAELQDKWEKGLLQINSSFEINGELYENVFQNTMVDAFVSNVVTLVYESDQSTDQLVLSWSKASNNSFVPNRIVKTTHSLTENVETIGDVAIIKLQFPSGVLALKGKVDTGAEICSLHCDGSPKIVGDVVRFENRDLSPNVIQMNLVDKQAVSSADGGVEYRPVIELNVDINGKIVKGVKFNLNDRSQMEYPVLIGQNALERTNFLVDPKQNDVKESYDFSNIEFEPLCETYDKSEAKQLYDLMSQTKLSLSDLLTYTRTITVERFNGME